MQVCVDTSWVCLQCTSVFMYRCKCISVCYLLQGRWACTLSMLSWPALQRVDPCVKWKVARPLLLLLHTLWQDTLNGQEIMFDPAAGQRGSQFGFKPAHKTNKKKTLGASLWWQHTGQISLWTLNIFYVYPPDTLHGKLQIHYRLKKNVWMVTSELLASFLLTPLAQYSWVGLLPSAKLTFSFISVKFCHCVLHSCRAIMVCLGFVFTKSLWRQWNRFKKTKQKKPRTNTETRDDKPTHRQMYMKTIPARLCRF